MSQVPGLVAVVVVVVIVLHQRAVPVVGRRHIHQPLQGVHLDARPRFPSRGLRSNRTFFSIGSNYILNSV